jgi:hypothetical protein
VDILFPEASNLINFLVTTFWLIGYIATPIALVWGWVSWVKGPRQRTFFSVCSLLGFCIGSASALFAVASAIYAHMHVFGYYDPTLMRIFRWGFLLSLSAILFSILGIWKPNSLRWFALICAVGTFLFWFAAAESE